MTTPNDSKLARLFEEAAENLAVYSLVDKGFIYRTNPHEKGRGAAAIYDLTQAGRGLNE